MPKTIALYGDSYVERLQKYCHEDLRVPSDVYWFGKGGLRSDFIKRNGEVDISAKAMFRKLKELKPDAVFLNVGGNDLTTSSEPRQVVDRILGLTAELQQAGVGLVYMTEILTRGDFSKCPDQEMNRTCFDRQRKKINSLLRGELKGKFITFPDINYPDDYLSDLVHLMETSSIKNNTGLKKFESRLRRIICSLKE